MGPPAGPRPRARKHDGSAGESCDEATGSSAAAATGSYDEQVASNVSSIPRTGIARLIAFVWRPSPAAFRRLALAGVVANSGIIVTGAAVRLSESGLGCPDWPKCTVQSLTATRTPGQTMVNTWIEFGNRLFTFVVMAVAVAVFVAAWRLRVAGPDGLPRRRTDLVWLAAAQPAGIILQAMLGGITVLTALNPAMVSVHFLVSMVIVALTVLLYVRCGEGTAPAQPLARADLRLLSGAVLAVAGLMFAAGTVVTGTGPLAGNASAPRYHLPLEGATQLHADIGWLFAGLAIALLAGLRLTGAPPLTVRFGWVLLATMSVQGTLGYIQYFTGLPPVLVGLHVLGSVLVWIAALRLFLSLRDRGTIMPVASEPAFTGVAAGPVRAGPGVAADPMAQPLASAGTRAQPQPESQEVEQVRGAPPPG